MVAQVDEQQVAVVALAVDPAREAGRLAGIVGAQRAAGMGAIGMHGITRSFRAGKAARHNRHGIAAALSSRQTRPCRRATASWIPWPCPAYAIPIRRHIDLDHPTAELAAFCERLRRRRFVTVDTEFMRERTYWPKLCLVQVAGPDEAAAIDPLAPGIDLAPLVELMADPKVAEGLPRRAAGPRDLPPRWASVPQPLFDTQVAAMVCGFGDQVVLRDAGRQARQGRSTRAALPTGRCGRSPAADRLCAGRRDPSARRLRKLARPLEKTGRLDWVAEEMAVLIDPATYRADPEQAWQRLKPRGNNRRLLGVLRAIAAWREREAQRVNIPRQRMLRTRRCWKSPPRAAAIDELRADPRHFPRLRRGPHGCEPDRRHRGGQGALPEAGAAAGAGLPRRGRAPLRRWFRC